MLTDTLKKTNEYLERVADRVSDEPHFVYIVRDALQYLEPITESYPQTDLSLYLKLMSTLDYRTQLDLDFHKSPMGMEVSYYGGESKGGNKDAYLGFRLADNAHQHLDSLCRIRKQNPYDKADRRVMAVVRKKLRDVMDEIETVGRLGAFEQDGD